MELRATKQASDLLRRSTAKLTKEIESKKAQAETRAHQLRCANGVIIRKKVLQ